MWNVQINEKMRAVLIDWLIEVLVFLFIITVVCVLWRMNCNY